MVEITEFVSEALAITHETTRRCGDELVGRHLRRPYENVFTFYVADRNGETLVIQTIQNDRGRLLFAVMYP